MAGLLKHWRESSSLIIASKRLMKPVEKTFVDKLLRKEDPPKVHDISQDVLRLLLLTRTSSSSFMPNAQVFPGGMLDNSDFSKEWFDILGGNNGLLEIFNRSDPDQPASPIFSRSRQPEFSHFSSEIALRLAAIRETFEESGILLARPKSDFTDKDLFSNSQPSFTTLCNLPKKLASKWRTSILSDPSQFLLMCKELEMVPDIWSLYEWSNWLTPPFMKKRFDTAFFVSCIDEAPDIVLSEESTHGMWVSPADVLKDYSHGLVTIAPPQVYELSRLVRFETVDDLLNFAWMRSRYRVERVMPVTFSCADGTVFVLPGDDLYPENPDLTGENLKEPLQRTETVEELNKLYPRHHRFVIGHDKRISLDCNVEFIDGHILPFKYSSDESSFQPKL